MWPHRRISGKIWSAHMTRFATSFALFLVLLPRPVAGQQALFVEGLTELARAMMTLSENRAQVSAAIDKMSAGLDAFGTQAAPSPDASLLGTRLRPFRSFHWPRMRRASLAFAAASIATPSSRCGARRPTTDRRAITTRRGCAARPRGTPPRGGARTPLDCHDVAGVGCGALVAGQGLREHQQDRRGAPGV
jgi:hypothetical protein